MISNKLKVCYTSPFPNIYNQTILFEFSIIECLLVLMIFYQFSAMVKSILSKNVKHKTFFNKILVFVVYSHIMLKASVSPRSPKLSSEEPSQYEVG